MALTSIRLIQFACLYTILCYLGVEAALSLRQLRQTPPARLQAPVDSQTQSSPSGQIPFLGVTVSLEQYDDPLPRRQALHRLQNAGFGWARLRIDWSRIEPQPGQFQWAWTDQVLSEIAAAGLAPVVVLDGSPPWARDSRDVPPQAASANDWPWRLAPPAQPETYARFAAAFARRYQKTVRYYQIWDEPNIAPHWGNRLIDPVAYARLLQEAARAVRAANPDAVILAAALAPTQDRGHTAIDEGFFLQRLYAAGAAPYFDAVLIQPFGFGTGPQDTRSRVDALNFRRAAWIRKVMVAAGDSQTPVWAVRFGWNRQPQDHWKTVSEASQRLFTAEAIRYARTSWPWLAALGWPIDRPDAPVSDPMWGFSLITVDNEEHPLLSVFSDASQATPEPLPSQNDMNRYARFVLQLLAVGLLLWWAASVLRSLPLRRWQAAYLSWPPASKLAVWAILLTTYYLAVWPPLVILCWLAAAFLIAAQPIAGLILAAAALPFHFQHKELQLLDAVWTVPPAQAALLATLTAIMPSQLPRLTLTLPRRLKPALKSLSPLSPGFPAINTLKFADLLVPAWVIVSLLTARNVWHWPGYREGLWELVAVPVLLYAAIRLIARQPRRQQAVLAALFAGGVLAAAVGITDWLTGGGVSVDGVRRLMGASYSPNQTALYLLRTLFVGIGILAARRRWRLAVAACCLLAATASLLTASRGALLLGLPAGAFLIAVAWRRHNALSFKLRSAALLTLLVGLALLLLYGERLLNLETLRARLVIWQGALALWRHFPLLGVGPGGFYWSYPAFLQPSPTANPNLLHAHSLWLEYATGWGLLGLAWLAALLAWLASLWRRSSRHQAATFRLGLLAALGAGLAHAQVDAFAALPELAAWNFAALALLATPDDKNL